MSQQRGLRAFSFSLFCLLTVALLLALGTWQAYRLQWKRDLIAQTEQRLSLPPAALPRDMDDPEAWNFRPVRIAGRFRHDLEQLLGPRSHRQESGFHLLTPMQLSDGRHVLVNRGWVPAAASDPRTRPASQQEGSVEIAGRLRTVFRKGAFTPEYQPGSRLWHWYDIDGLSRELGLPLPPLVVEVTGPAAAGRLPVPAPAAPEIPNNHLQYALTWYGLAAVVAAMYGVWLYRRRRG